LRKLYKIFWVALLILMVAAAPVLGAKITKFNGVAADASDQVSHLVIAKGQEGNVTVQFDNEYTLDSTNTTLVIDFAVNITGYTYSASGDTANLSVTRNPLNLTFEYSGNSNVTISTVNLTFKFDSGLSTAEGIDSATVMTSVDTLAYVSNYTDTYTPDNTTEKITYIVYDPAKVYAYSGTVKSADGNFSATIGTDIEINLTKAATNKVVFEFNTYRSTYDESLVPVSKAYFSVFLNDTYFTNVVPIAVANVTDIGLKEFDGYTEAIFMDTKPAANDTFQVLAYAWDTNGTIEDGFKFKYTIDPIGGLSAEAIETKSVSVIVPAALIAPPIAMYWWQYEIYGISVLGWIGIIVTLAIIGLLIYRKAKGLPLIPRSLGGLSSIVAVYTLLAIWAQITEWFSTATDWLKENWLFVSILFIVTLIVIVVSMFHYGTRE